MNSEFIDIQIELKSDALRSEDIRLTLDKQRDLLVTSLYYLLRDELADQMNGVLGKDWMINVKAGDADTMTLSQAPNKVYRAERQSNRPGDIEVLVTDRSGSTVPLKHISPYTHTPDGLEWAYGGSGPADLALSILANYFGEEPSKVELFYGRCKCWDPHQAFKREFITTAPKEGFSISSEQIEDWLKQWARDEI